MNEQDVRNITREFLDEEHLLGFIKIFEKEHNLFRGSHDKIQLPAALEIPDTIINQININSRFDLLDDVSIPEALTTGDFIQYDADEELWTRQAALTEGFVLFPDSSGYFTGDANLFWDAAKEALGIGTNDIEGVGGGIKVRVHIVGPDGKFAGATYGHPGVNLIVENELQAGIQIVSEVDGYLLFTDDDSNPPAGMINYDHANGQMDFFVATGMSMRIALVGVSITKTDITATNPLTVWQPGTEAGYGTYGGVVARFRADEAKHTAIAIDARTGYDPILAFSTNGFCIWDMRFDNSDVNQLQIRYQGGEGNFDNTTVFEILAAGSVRIPASYLGIMSKNELRFYDDSTNYVGFEAPELTDDQIWVLPNADGPANEVLGTDGNGNIIWRTFSEIAGYAPSADEKVKVDVGATADYLGAAFSDGALRTDGTQITYTDGGNFVTLTTAQAIDATASPTFVGLTLSGATYLYGDVYADRYLNRPDNMFLGVDVAGDGNLAHTTGNEGWYNTGMGWGSLKEITKGYQNTAIGTGCLHECATSNQSVAVGYQALYSSTSGTLNVALGMQALYKLTSGYRNMAIGRQTLFENLTGSYNTAVGNDALSRMTSNGAVGIGTEAGLLATSGGGIFIGYSAGRSCTSGYHNTYIGYQSGWTGTTNYDNTLIGYRAAYGGAGATYVQCTCIGHESGRYLVGGHFNTFIGNLSGHDCTSGQKNIGMGVSVLHGNQTGSGNTALGHNAGKGIAANNHSNNVFIGCETGFAVTTGSNNVLIGYQAGQDLTTGAGNVVIGYMAGEGWLVAQNNLLVIANSDTATPLIYGEFDNEKLLFNTTEMGFFKTATVVQQAHIVDADGTLADITTKYNTLLSQLEAYGLLAAA